MKKDSIVMELVHTRINGNSIKGNITYENMLKRVSKADIQNCPFNFNHLLYGTKLDMIEQISRQVKKRNID